MNHSRSFSRTNILVYIYILFLPIIFPHPAHSGEQRKLSLTLTDAVMMALDKNRGLMASGKYAEVAQAHADALTGRLLPIISASYSASRTDSPINVFGSKLLQKRFSASDFAITRLNNPDTINNYHTDISVTVPVYQGGALWAGKRAGTENAAVARWQYQADLQATILRVVETFAQLKQAIAQRESSAQALKAARSHLVNTQALERRGIAIASDVMDVRAHALEAEVVLQSADHQVAAMRDRLRLLLGIGPQTPLMATGNPGLTLPARNITDWLENAEQNRPELKEEKHRLEAAHAGVDAARAPFRPSIALQGVQEWNSSTASPRNGNITLAAELRFNFFSGGSDRARLQAAEAEKEALQLTLAEMGQRVRNEVQAAWRNLEEAKTRIVASEQVLQQSLESLRIRKLREQQGLERTSDVLDTQSHADHARAKAIRARYALIIAKARLLAAAGQLTPEVIR
ncbi:MAG: hypothetical protein BMS9Abin18_0138 [Zetaproteobacteria bacterium]|nr:MAG: hypothetical protein BMS9Abin18_0138 [Zetaproteobacteria bacterium]